MLSLSLKSLRVGVQGGKLFTFSVAHAISQDDVSREILACESQRVAGSSILMFSGDRGHICPFTLGFLVGQGLGQGLQAGNSWTPQVGAVMGRVVDL